MGGRIGPEKTLTFRGFFWLKLQVLKAPEPAFLLAENGPHPADKRAPASGIAN